MYPSNNSSKHWTHFNLSAHPTTSKGCSSTIRCGLHSSEELGTCLPDRCSWTADNEGATVILTKRLQDPVPRSLPQEQRPEMAADTPDT